MNIIGVCSLCKGLVAEKNSNVGIVTECLSCGAVLKGSQPDLPIIPMEPNRYPKSPYDRGTYPGWPYVQPYYPILPTLPMYPYTYPYIGDWPYPYITICGATTAGNLTTENQTRTCCSGEGSCSCKS